MNKLLKTACITGGAILAFKGLDNRLETTYYNIKSKELPYSFDGFKIVHLSDLHCESIPGLFEEISKEKPDLIVCTGDMTNDYGPFEPALKFIEHIINIAPVYMVTGNHDIWRVDYDKMEKAFTNTGAVFLHNERVSIKNGVDEISLTGIDDPFSREQNTISSSIAKSLKKVPSVDIFDILLFHRANLLDQVKDFGFDLILSGHMHGGQIRLPHIGGLIAPRSSFGANSSLFFPKYFGGKFDSDNTQMIVSRGLGNPMIVPRLFNRPEMVVVTLKAQ